MSKNIHELYKKYLDIQSGKGQNMADGGKVENESSVSDDLKELFAKAFNKPTPAPTPDQTQEEKYSKIREQNRSNINNPSSQKLSSGGIAGYPRTMQYFDGGKVEHDRKNLLELKAAFDKFIGEESKEPEKMSKGGKVGSGERFAKLENKLSHQKGIKDPAALAASIGNKKYGKAKMQKMAHAHMDEGGIVSNFVPEGDIKHYDDGGLVDTSLAQKLAGLFHSSDPNTPVLPSEDARQQTQDSMRKAFGYADGGQIPQDPRTKTAYFNKEDLPQHFDGSEGSVVQPEDPITGSVDPNSPEGLEMIANAQYPEAQRSLDSSIPEEEPVSIESGVPSKESDLEESKNPEDMALEEEMANKDFEAGEKADQSKDDLEKELNSEEEPENGDVRNLEGLTLDKEEALKGEPSKDEAAGLDTTSAIQKLIDAQKQGPNALEKAQHDRDMMIAGDKISQGGALIGAGLSKTDPSLALKLIEQNSKYNNLPVQKYEEIIQNQQNDPNSPMSKMTRDYFKSKNIQVPDSASASDLKMVAPNYQKDQSYQMALQKVLLQQSGASQRNLASNTTKEDAITAANKRAKEHNDILKQAVADKKEMTKLAKEQKSSNDQNKSLTQTQQLLESARGNPAAAQAEKDLYSVQKANSLASMYGDPDKLSPQQVSLLVSEVSKIATGGVPTGHEQEALKPGTAASKLAGLWSQLTNKPTGANAGAFIKQFQDYNNALAKDAQKVIQDKYGRVIETRKKQLGDDNYKALQDQYLNRFKPAEEVPVDADLSKMSPAELKNYIKLHGGS